MFERLLDSLPADMLGSEIMEELMSLRADFAIRHALDGFGMDYEDALELLRNESGGLSDEDRARRDVVVAAVDNLVDFAVAEEYRMASSVMDSGGFDSYDTDEETLENLEQEGPDDYDLEEVMAIFSTYNDRYALIENQDIEYAMVVAAQLYAVSNTTVLMYMTQGDERVRPWHLQYEGFSAPKSSFPAWLVPPIEHGCRCYLVEDTVLGSVRNAAVRVPEIPEWFNQTFKESVALGGRIFSDEHPYFQVGEDDAPVLRDIAGRIKSRYFNG